MKTDVIVHCAGAMSLRDAGWFLALCEASHIDPDDGEVIPYMYQPGVPHAPKRPEAGRVTADRTKDLVTCPWCLDQLRKGFVHARGTKFRDAFSSGTPGEYYVRSLCKTAWRSCTDNLPVETNLIIGVGRITDDYLKDPVTCTACLELAERCKYGHVVDSATRFCKKCGISELSICELQDRTDGCVSTLFNTKSFKHNRSLKGNVNVPLLMVDDPSGDDVAD